MQQPVQNLESKIKDLWPKNGPLSNKRNITVSILKPIEPGLNKEDFLNLLEKNIYSELDKNN